MFNISQHESNETHCHVTSPVFDISIIGYDDQSSFSVPLRNNLLAAVVVRRTWALSFPPIARRATAGRKGLGVFLQIFYTPTACIQTPANITIVKRLVRTLHQQHASPAPSSSHLHTNMSL
ncbi:unnamed protein product [Caenorhabditis nigoni]